MPNVPVSQWSIVTGLLALVVYPASGQTAGPGFTYQGQLKQSGQPYNGAADFEFRLFDAESVGTQVGGTVILSGVVVTDGLFAVELNASGEFGSEAFNGEARWLEITVNGTPLSPRQLLTPAPYANYALKAANGHALDAVDGSPTDAVFVDTVGQVGIGTTSPDWKLHVAGGVHDGIKVSVADATDTSAQVVLSAGLEPQNGQGAIFQLNAPSNVIEPSALLIVNRTNGPLTLGTNNQPVMRLRPSGNVAIGTTSEDYWRLHVVGDVHDGIKVEVPDGADTSAQVVLSAGLEPQYGQGAIFQLNAPSSIMEPNTLLVYNRTAGPLVLGTDNQHRLDITASGDVGIGTTTPAARLHVAGVTQTDGLRMPTGAVSGHVLTSDATGTASWQPVTASVPNPLLLSGDLPAAAVIEGTNTSSTALSVGVRGVLNNASPGSLAAGVYGRVESSGTEGIGVHGRHTGDGWGVYGFTIGGRGVYGQATGGSGVGVYGQAQSATGYGGYFRNIAGTGTALRVEGKAHADEILTDVLEISGGADLAEHFEIDVAPEPGTVLVIDSRRPGALRVSARPYDRLVAGVVSGAGALEAGVVLGSQLVEGIGVPVALSGRVWVRCDATQRAVKPGDLLTTSDRPGHAMVASDPAATVGAVIGKAMSSLDQGEVGLVLMLISLQ